MGGIGWVREGDLSALVEVHVRLVFCGFCRWVVCVVGCSLACRVVLGLLLSVDGPVLLGRLLVLGELHFGFGLGHDGVASGEKFLKYSRMKE